MLIFTITRFNGLRIPLLGSSMGKLDVSSNEAIHGTAHLINGTSPRHPLVSKSLSGPED